MRPKQPTFFLLNGATGWRTGDSPDVAVAEGGGIRLAGSSNGPLALTSEDGSLGGLVLPLGMALAGSAQLHLLDTERQEIKHYQVGHPDFVPLPGVGGIGTDPRQFSADTTGIAITSGNLYVADRGNARVQVFALQTLALRHIWGPLGAEGETLCRDDADDSYWEPMDMAGWDGVAVVLDCRFGRVYRHRAGIDRLDPVISVPEAAGRWTRIALDLEHRIYLLDAAKPSLEIYDINGHRLGDADDAGDLLGRFPPPMVRLDHLGRFCLPGSLALACGRTTPDAPPPREDQLALCRVDQGLMFDRRGRALPTLGDPEPAGPMPYRRQGLWLSEPLDSDIYNCQWHRIELELQTLPVGSRVTLSTYTDNEPRSLADILSLPAHLWETRAAIVGGMQSSLETSTAQTADAMVLSHQGQYLWLRLELAGDGYTTAVVDAARLHYPRQSYLQYLPEAFGFDDEARWFLQRFLSLFQTEWDELERTIEEFAQYLDPAAVPGGPWLEYLAQWLALPLEGEWDDEQKRRLLMAAPELYPHRGTPPALGRYVQAYLENLTGLNTDQLMGFPLLLEGFRRRNYLMLERSALSGWAPLWSAGVFGRLQLDVYATADEVRLLGTGDPDRDVFHAHAHRFQVFVPAAWVRSADDERLLRRALDAEKPAHTDYTLCLVEPRMRVGIQSTVGVDTVIGQVPVATLACNEDDGAAPSRPPRGRLGYDTVLAGRCDPSGGLPLNPGARVGMNTTLS